MSYLNNLRLVFSGDFQADVSTINNDVCYFDNATFEDRFQCFQTETTQQGWWNPIGFGAFRLINCKVRVVYYQDSTSSTNDPVVNLYINVSNNRVGGKIVDLNPQWQQASELWGLTMRLSDASDNLPNLFSGAFEPVPCRDLWLTRRAQVKGDKAASAVFQSVLTDVQWNDNLIASPFLEELKAATTEGLLSVRLTTFNYEQEHDEDRFTLGKVVGVIGPYLPQEPRSFIVGRRMYQPVPKDQSLEQQPDNLYFFDCSVDETTRSVFADLSNTLPLDRSGNPENIGDLQLAVLANENIQPLTTVTRTQDFTPLGDSIPYTNDDWLSQTSGIWAVALSSEELELVRKQPLAIIKKRDDNTEIVAIRETLNGWLIRAEKFVHRVEPGETVKTTLFAACYGQPFANANVLFSLIEPLTGQGGWPKEAPYRPKAPIPLINQPTDVVSFQTNLTTDEKGKVEIAVSTSNPNNPRQYLDGQVYLIKYQLEGQAEGQREPWDYIVFLLYDKYQVPEQPSWCEHIKNIGQAVSI